jgi:hypothetical protein
LQDNPAPAAGQKKKSGCDIMGEFRSRTLENHYSAIVVMLKTF